MNLGNHHSKFIVHPFSQHGQHHKQKLASTQQPQKSCYLNTFLLFQHNPNSIDGKFTVKTTISQRNDVTESGSSAFQVVSKPNASENADLASSVPATLTPVQFPPLSYWLPCTNSQKPSLGAHPHLPCALPIEHWPYGLTPLLATPCIPAGSYGCPATSLGLYDARMQSAKLREEALNFSQDTSISNLRLRAEEHKAAMKLQTK